MSETQKGPHLGIDRSGRERLVAAISQLTPRHRTVFVLIEVEGYSCEEVAEIMNSTAGGSYIAFYVCVPVSARGPYAKGNVCATLKSRKKGFVDGLASTLANHLRSR